jgi:NitT/TauT family transport system permease protein
MVVASSRFDVPLVFAGLVVTSAMGIAMYIIAAVIEGRMTGWAVRSVPERVTAAAAAATPG